MASVFPDASAASEALSRLLQDYWGRRATEELLTEFLARLAEEHQFYLCEPTMIETEYDYLDYFRRTRTPTEEEKKAQVDGWGKFAHPRVEVKDCIQCGWTQEVHLWADYMCVCCRAKEELFGVPDPASGKKAVDDRHYDLYLEPHSRYHASTGHAERLEIWSREPDGDRMEIAGRPLSLLAFEFLEHKRNASLSPQAEELPVADHHKKPGDCDVSSRMVGGANQTS